MGARRVEPRTAVRLVGLPVPGGRISRLLAAAVRASPPDSRTAMPARSCIPTREPGFARRSTSNGSSTHRAKEWTWPRPATGRAPGLLHQPVGPVQASEPGDGISVWMRDVIGTPEFQIRSVRLAKESPGDAVLEDRAAGGRIRTVAGCRMAGEGEAARRPAATMVSGRRGSSSRATSGCARTAASRTPRRRPPASSASSRWTANGGSSIPTGTCSGPPA